MASTFGNWSMPYWSMPYWSGLSSAQRSAPQLYQDWLRGQQVKNSPLAQVKDLTASDLSGLSTNLYYDSGSNGDGSESSSQGSSVGSSSSIGPGLAGAIGTGLSIGAQYGGIPGNVANPIGSVVGAALQGKSPSEVGYAAAKSVATGLLGKAVPGIGLALGLAGMFGIDPFAELGSYLNVDNDLPIGFGYGWGMRNQADDPPIPGLTQEPDEPALPGLGYSDYGSFGIGFDGKAPESSYGDLGNPDSSTSGPDGDGSGGGGTGSNGGEGGAGTGGEDGGASDGNSWAQGGLVQYRRGCRC